jgi:hypothetical protein
MFRTYETIIRGDTPLKEKFTPMKKLHHLSLDCYITTVLNVWDIYGSDI